MIPFPKIFPRAQTRRSPARWLGREVVPAASHPARKARLARPGLEPLEGRQVPTVFTFPAINMTPPEQYMLELINQARANPTAVAQKFGIDLNEGLPAGTISATPKQPLAPNVSLLNAARTHLSDMLSHNFFSHTGSDGSQPSDRITRAGYASPMISMENQAWSGTSGTPNVTQMIDNEFRDLFIDPSWPGRPHRLAMLNDAAKEIGSGEKEGLFNPNNPSQLYHSVLVTQDFGARDGNSFLTGVVYVELNHNGVYDIGEEVPGATVRARPTTAISPTPTTNDIYQTTTGMSGGYSLPLPPGTYSVEFTIPPDFLKKLKGYTFWYIPGPWIIGQNNLSCGPAFSGEFF